MSAAVLLKARVSTALMIALAAISLGVMAIAAWPARARDVVDIRKLPMRFEWVPCQEHCRGWISATGVITSETPKAFEDFARDRDLTGATYAAISATLFGGAAMAEAGAIQRAVDTYLNATSWEIAATLAGLPAWAWHPGRGPMHRAARDLRAAVERLLDRWQATGGGGDHLLSRLMAAEEPGHDGGGISRGRVLNNLLTFLNAGHETTAKALLWTLFLLSQEPVWQARLREEVRAVAGDGPIEGHHVEQLVLTRQVFEEAMRLYAPAPVLTRQAREDCDIGGVRLKAGSVIFIPIWAIHRHRRLWDAPERFRPERFAPGARETIRRTQYLPFGYGPRICIGSVFSRIEGVTMLATLLRGAAFTWPGGPDPEPLARVTLWPRGGMRLRVTPLGPGG